MEHRKWMNMKMLVSNVWDGGKKAPKSMGTSFFFLPANWLEDAAEVFLSSGAPHGRTLGVGTSAAKPWF